jgi:hypothetical protein
MYKLAPRFPVLAMNEKVRNFEVHGNDTFGENGKVEPKLVEVYEYLKFVPFFVEIIYKLAPRFTRIGDIGSHDCESEHEQFNGKIQAGYGPEGFSETRFPFSQALLLLLHLAVQLLHLPWSPSKYWLAMAQKPP